MCVCYYKEFRYTQSRQNSLANFNLPSPTVNNYGNHGQPLITCQPCANFKQVFKSVYLKDEFFSNITSYMIITSKINTHIYAHKHTYKLIYIYMLYMLYVM